MTARAPTLLRLDYKGLTCPAPMLALAREAASIHDHGGTLVVEADDPTFRLELDAWIRNGPAQLVEFIALDQPAGAVRAVIHVEAGAPPSAPAPSPAASPASVSLDLRGVLCPGPIIALARLCSDNPAGTELKLLADDPSFKPDLHSWLEAGRAELLSFTERSGVVEAQLRVLEPLATNSATRSGPGARDDGPGRCALLVRHDDHQALLSALLVANGAAAAGMDTSVFFTCLGLGLLRADGPIPRPATPRHAWRQRLIKWLTPRGPRQQELGQLDLAGFGKRPLAGQMRSGGAPGLPELIARAQELGVTFTACTMSMTMLGITEAELHPYPNLEIASVSTFIESARDANLSLVF